MLRIIKSTETDDHVVQEMACMNRICSNFEKAAETVKYDLE
jgi:hypothetical protein